MQRLWRKTWIWAAPFLFLVRDSDFRGYWVLTMQSSHFHLKIIPHCCRCSMWLVSKYQEPPPRHCIVWFHYINGVHRHHRSSSILFWELLESSRAMNLEIYNNKISCINYREIIHVTAHHALLSFSNQKLYNDQTWLVPVSMRLATDHNLWRHQFWFWRFLLKASRLSRKCYPLVRNWNPCKVIWLQCSPPFFV